MTFIPRGSKMVIRAVADTNILLFGFTTTIIRTDMEMLEYFCTHAGKKDCEYIALNPLIFKSVYTRHNVSSDVMVGAF